MSVCTRVKGRVVIHDMGCLLVYLWIFWFIEYVC